LRDVPGRTGYTNHLKTLLNIRKFASNNFTLYGDIFAALIKMHCVDGKYNLGGFSVDSKVLSKYQGLSLWLCRWSFWVVLMNICPLVVPTLVTKNIMYNIQNACI
jgi:hypothetical protein